MPKFLLTLLGISIFTASFCSILWLRPYARPSVTSPVVHKTTLQNSDTQTKTPRSPLIGQPTSSTFTPTSTTSATPTTTPISTPEATPAPEPTPEKHIYVSLKDQNLQYFEGSQLVGEFKISSGLRGTPTPPGEYTVLVKKPAVDYKGPNYDFPNTKWNLLFKANVPLNYYIHGAYWHHNFGHPMSHGCINVAYANMEGLYNWADVGTKITIQ